MAVATTEPEAVTDPEAAAEEDRKASADISAMARGGLLNLVGAAGTGLFTFALVTVLARGLGPASYGAFVSAMGLFTILSNTAELGADTGLVRSISRLRALDRVRDIRKTVYVALFPPLVVGTVFGIALWMWAPQLADIFGKGKGSGEIAEFARWMAPFLPAGGVVLVLLAGTRGFGTMIPTVTVDRLGRPFVQVALALGLILAAGSHHQPNHGLVALSWAAPQLIGAVIATWWFWGLLLKAERRDRRTNGRRRSRPTTVLASKFWRFTAPRGMAGIFQIVVLWLNTLLVGRLGSTAQAGVFNAATRYVTAGLMVGVAIQQVAGPKLSELMAQRNWDRARGVYQTTTGWLMVATWPLYLTFALFAPTLLRVFGHGFQGGTGALEVLGLTMLVATAVGTVDMVLLMGGKSSWNLINTVVGLSSNIILNFVLIPRYGGTGAAIAWSSSIIFTNLAPLVQVWKFLGMHPFGRGFPKVVLAAGASYGALGLVLRMALGTSLTVFALYQVVALLLYLPMLWRHREALQLTVLMEELKRKNRRKTAAPTNN
ncbi:MAG TPA: polysaccharide biosynthesis C-terminal domain-containing protein [Acidimicrobiia bacterium]|nr:polysaccharide biosynthesis C-terminal domain-containing protein [Acidimicrobiia bacterium]